jgi:predicted aspartyl protease
LELIGDTGSTYCWVPKDDLEKIGIRIYGKRRFRTITGDTGERQYGHAMFTYDGTNGGSEVVFAKAKDGNVIGALATVAMGLKIDPKNVRITKEHVFLAL